MQSFDRRLGSFCLFSFLALTLGAGSHDAHAKKKDPIAANYQSEDGCLSLRKGKTSGTYTFYGYMWGTGPAGYTCTISGEVRQVSADASEALYEYIVPPPGEPGEENTCRLRIHITRDLIRLEDPEAGCAHGKPGACGANARLDRVSFSRGDTGRRSCEAIEKEKAWGK